MIVSVNDTSAGHHSGTLCFYREIWIEEGPKKEMLSVQVWALCFPGKWGMPISEVGNP